MSVARSALVALLLCAISASGWSAAPVSFADLAHHEQFKAVKISPDGRHLAATAVTGNGRTVLSLFDLGAKTRVNLVGRNGDDVLHFWWISPGLVLYDVGERVGGWDMPIPTGELFTVEADGRNANMLYGYRMQSQQTGTALRQAVAEGGSARFLSRIEGEPDHILVTISNWVASGTSGSLTEPYRMDVRTGVKHRVAVAPMREAEYLADRHGRVRFAFGTDPGGKRIIYMRSADDGAWQLLPSASAARAWPLAFSDDEQTVWFACSAERGFGVCRFDPATRNMTPAWSNPRVPASGLARGLAEDSVIGVEYTDGRPSIALFDSDAPGAQALVSLIRQTGENARFVSGTPDGSKAIALVDADVDPGSFFLFDRAANRFTPLLQRAAWVHPEQLGRAAPISLVARDGLELQGYVTYPPGRDNAKGLPMVVFVHGGPYGVRDWWEYDPYVQAMATRGYAVLQVNYRGSGGYGFEFEKAGWLEWGGRMQDDVTDATRWAISQGIADPDRICIYGGSYGGYAALEGAVSVPDLYKCAIGYVGVYDLRLMFTRGDIPQNIYGKEYLKRVLGDDMDELARRSPIYQLDKLKAKIMLIVGGKDTRVPPVQGTSLHDALAKRGVQHEWLYQPNEWHGFYDEKNLAELFEKVDAFLAANIGAGATPASDTASVSPAGAL